MYKLTLKTMGREYSAKGKTIDGALSKMVLGWEQIKGKGTIYLDDGKRKLEKMLFAPMLRRIFNNKITRSTQAKNFELLMKNK
jgi:hypothetical protein